MNGVSRFIVLFLLVVHRRNIADRWIQQHMGQKRSDRKGWAMQGRIRGMKRRSPDLISGNVYISNVK